MKQGGVASPGTPRLLVEATACVTATLGAGLLYGQFFATGQYLLPLAVASVGGAVVAVIASVRRWSFVRTLLVVVVGFLLLATYGVFGETVQYGVPTRDTATEIYWGVVGGWARMLTVGLPAEVRGELLVTPVLLVWSAAFAGVTLAGRTRSVLAPVGPPLAAFVVALLFVGNQPGIQVAATAVFLFGVLSLIVLRANRIESAITVGTRATMSGLLLGALVVTAVAGIGVAGGRFLPFASGQDRFDPRDLHSPPVWIADTLTPLAGLKSQLREQPPRQLFTVDISTADALSVDRIRIAALDAYDGTLWTSADKYVVAGHHLAAGQKLTKTRPASARIEIEGLAGPFLPVLGRPSSLDLTAGAGTSEIGFSVGPGVLATTKRVPRGLRYDIVGEVCTRDDALPLALPSTAPEFARYKDLPNGLPPELRVLAQDIIGNASTPYGKLTAIERYLRNTPYDLDTEPGHSYGALKKALTGADHAGYAEQHAAAFAVLARAVGFPARVAVGYRLRDSHGGIHPVTTGDAHAWAEVAFDDYGWVTFDPTDPTRLSNEPKPQPEGPVDASPPPNRPLAAPPVMAPQPDPSGQSNPGWGGVVRTTALVVVSLVSLGVIVATLTAAEKARRRHRRQRAPSRSAQVLGAWREAADRLVEHGVTMRVSATDGEAAEHAWRVLGTAAEPVVALAPLATTAVFAPGKVTDHDIEQAWQLEAQLRRGLNPRRLSPRWLRAKLDPRPLLAGWRDARQCRKSLRRLGVG